MSLNVLRYDSRRFFLLMMRLFVGVWLLYVGLVKWIPNGPQPTVNWITSAFAETWSPRPLNIVLAWVILIAEPVLGVLLLVGLMPRLIWTLTALLMFMLMIGQVILMKPEAGQMWMYIILTVACAALSEPRRDTPR